MNKKEKRNLIRVFFLEDEEEKKICKKRGGGGLTGLLTTILSFII